MGELASGLFRVFPGPLFIGVFTAFIRDKVRVHLAAHAFAPDVLGRLVPRYFFLVLFMAPLCTLFAHAPKVAPPEEGVEGYCPVHPEPGVNGSWKNRLVTVPPGHLRGSRRGGYPG